MNRSHDGYEVVGGADDRGLAIRSTQVARGTFYKGRIFDTKGMTGASNIDSNIYARDIMNDGDS